jgi:hypothetical protein
MEFGPLADESQRPARQRTRKHLTRPDQDLSLMFGVLGMEVRWRMIVVVHRDDDPVER